METIFVLKKKSPQNSNVPICQKSKKKPKKKLKFFKMTSNLVNIYAHIKNEYSQFDSSLIVPPTYIKTLTGLSNKIVFVYRYVSSFFFLLFFHPK